MTRSARVTLQKPTPTFLSSLTPVAINNTAITNILDFESDLLFNHSTAITRIPLNYKLISFLKLFLFASHCKRKYGSDTTFTAKRIKTSK
jgi:hypothetical protein